jgi:hypothetical protein
MTIESFWRPVGNQPNLLEIAPTVLEKRDPATVLELHVDNGGAVSAREENFLLVHSTLSLLSVSTKKFQ